MTHVQLRYQWDRLRSSYWFLPVLAAVFAVALARLLVWCDELLPNALVHTHVNLFVDSLDGMRRRLGNNIVALLAVGGVIFPMLTIPMTMAISQYGSRLLRIYQRDRFLQTVLGLYVGSFFYCVALGIFIAPDVDSPALPQLSMLVALLLCLACFASIVALAHHISVILQAPNVAAAAAVELREQIDYLTQETDQQMGNKLAAEQDPIMALLEWGHEQVRSVDSGYVRKVDPYRVMELIKNQDLTISLTARPGDFVCEGDLLAEVWHPKGVDTATVEQLRRCFQLGNGRTPTQDMRFAVRQLTELAMRAMSPAINDPFTAMTCLDHLGDCLGRYAGMVRQYPHYYDRNKRLRIMTEPVGFDELLDCAFTMLRRTSRDNCFVLEHMAVVLGRIAEKTNLPERTRPLRAHLDLVAAEAAAGGLLEADSRRVQACCKAIIERHQLEAAKEIEEES